MKKDEGYKNIITATDLKKNLGKYLEYVQNDNEVIVTKNGKKAIRLSPYITDYDRYFAIKEKAVDYIYGGKKVSYEEFMEIYENSELRMEFINGEIVLLASPSSFHQDISGSMYIRFREYLTGKKCKAFYAPFDVHFYKIGFKEPDVMQPDLLIACDTDEKINENGRYMGTPSLVVEILSRSTRSKDMVDKLNTYMLSGVKEFWVVDRKNETVLVYSFKEYKVDNLATYKKGDTVKSSFFEGLEMKVSEIFSY